MIPLLCSYDCGSCFCDNCRFKMICHAVSLFLIAKAMALGELRFTDPALLTDPDGG